MATSKIGSSVFKGLKTPRELLQYNLMRGVTDFSNLEQFDLYEKGYPFLVCVKAPQFLLDLASKNTEIATIVSNYVHVIENDFRGLDGLDNITGEANGEITNGIRSIQLINKVTKPSQSNFTMRYFERSGSLLTKGHELYLTAIKDPDTQVKHYHGLIDDWVYKGIYTISGADPGPHQECWSFMYFITDNTMTKIERAFLICASQPTAAPYSELYTGDKGDISFVELSLSFNGFIINNDMVYEKAQKMLLAMRSPYNTTGSRIIVDSNNFAYTGIDEIKVEKNTADKYNSWWNSNGTMNTTYAATQMRSDVGNISPDVPKYSSEGAYGDSLKRVKEAGGEHFTDINATNM